VKRGCFLGCAGFLILLALLAGLAALALERLDVLREAPVVHIDTFATPAPAILLRAQLDRPEVMSLLTEALDQTPSWLVEKFAPHEISFSVEPRVAAGHNEMVLAFNLKRLAGFLDFAIRDTDEWRFWLNQEIVSAQEEAEGLYVVRSTIPFEAGLTDHIRPLAEEAAGEAVAPFEDPLFQVRIDNRGGQALLALAPMVTQQPAEYDPARKPFAEIAQLEGFFRRFSTADAAVDLPDSGALQVRVHVRVPDRAAGESLLFFLMPLRDTAYRELLQNDLVLDGFWSQTDTALTGDFTISGFRQKAMEYIRARAN
jgi:hypothetical protein